MAQVLRHSLISCQIEFDSEAVVVRSERSALSLEDGSSAGKAQDGTTHNVDASVI